MCSTAVRWERVVYALIFHTQSYRTAIQWCEWEAINVKLLCLIMQCNFTEQGCSTQSSTSSEEAALKRWVVSIICRKDVLSSPGGPNFVYIVEIYKYVTRNLLCFIIFSMFMDTLDDERTKLLSCLGAFRQFWGDLPQVNTKCYYPLWPCCFYVVRQKCVNHEQVWKESQPLVQIKVNTLLI